MECGLDGVGVEAALQLQEQHGGQTIALSMGPATAEEAVRKALQMGVDDGVLVSDDALAGSDALATARTLAAAIAKVGADLVVMGIESTDAKMSVVPAMVSEFLQWPMLTLAQSLIVDPAAGTATIERQTASGHDVVTASLPAVVSVVEKFNEPRYPSFKGIMAAKSKPVDTLTVADLGLDGQVGWAGGGQQIVAIEEAPAREAGEVIEDDGSAFEKIVAYLDNLKVL